MLRINPAFDRYLEEARTVGDILASFGELEVLVCYNASKVTELGNIVLGALYRIRSTRSRLEAADALTRPVCEKFGLALEQADAFARVMRCLQIRNQYAHCNWGDDESGGQGLFFTDLTESAQTAGFSLLWKHIDVPLLRRQATYFAGALEALRFIDHEMAVKQGKLSSHFWPRPPALEPPPLHNSAIQHIPPWLTEADKALHVARAQAALGGAPTPTPAQQALDTAREAKRAQRRADRDRDVAKRSDPDSQQ